VQTIITTLLFYAFATVLIGSAVAVVTARNPVHSVLFLILGFFNAAGLFLLAGAEFLAMILVIVYVGAVAVLFLFVVMMLDVNFSELRSGFQHYAPVGLLVGGVLFVELVLVLAGWKLAPGAAQVKLAPIPTTGTNTAALGRLIYTDYVFLFQAAGLVLLVAMIGAIVLTLREKQTSRHQSIAQQVTRMPADTMELADVVSGAGVKEFLRPKAPEPEPEHEHGGGNGGHGHGGHH
jgi:NADH-quinone oxidoreductase subunit J